MNEAVQYVIDDYLTAQFSDDPDAPKRAEKRLEGYVISYGKDQIEEWIKERAKVIYGTRDHDDPRID